MSSRQTGGNMGANVLRYAALLADNPMLFSEKAIDRLRLKFSRIPKNETISSIRDVRFHFDFNLDPAIRLMYLGIYEKALVRTMRKHLKKGDVFLDIGANIGYISAVAASIVGKEGQVHSFEPVSEYFTFLKKLAELNPEYSFFMNNCAAGDSKCKEEINVSRRGNIGWNTIVKSFMKHEESARLESVEMVRLDSYLAEKDIRHVGFIKIDTEGFEFPVLKGLSGFLKNNPSERPPVCVEFCPEANLLMGIEPREINDFMSSYSYHPYSLESRRKIDLLNLENTTDILFLVK